MELENDIENEGLLGRWFYEHPNNIPTDELDQMKWHSWENERSFWIRREYLIQAIQDVGFEMVFEQYDGIGKDIGIKMTSDEYKSFSRGTFIGIKNGII
jgi:hypothetical protein